MSVLAENYQPCVLISELDVSPNQLGTNIFITHPAPTKALN